MRIVGGKYKGRIFTPDKKFSSRPTTDQAKEALFNILTNRYDFTGLKILDLFSGTGSISYEFISRGVESVTSVELNHRHTRFIREGAEKLDIHNIKIIQHDAFRFVKNCGEQFDIVFADPPFDLPSLADVPGAILDSEILKEHGLLIVEHAKNHDFSTHPLFSELRKYGKVQFSFFVAKG
jgi:16S rRNA (guanine966-N2)-methyltransferase